MFPIWLSFFVGYAKASFEFSAWYDEAILVGKRYNSRYASGDCLSVSYWSGIFHDARWSGINYMETSEKEGTL